MASDRKKRNWQSMTTDDWIEWLYEIGCGRLPREETVRSRLRFQYDMLMELFNDWKYVEDAFFSKYPRKAHGSWPNGGLKVVAGTKEVKNESVSTVETAVEPKAPEKEVDRTEDGCNVTEDAMKTDEMKEAVGVAKNLPANSGNSVAVDVVDSEVENTEVAESRFAEIKEEEGGSDAEGDAGKTPGTEPEKAGNIAESFETGADVESGYMAEELVKAKTDAVGDMTPFSENGEFNSAAETRAEKTATDSDTAPPWFLQAESDGASGENAEGVVAGDHKSQKRRKWSREACLEFLAQARQRLGRDATQPDINALAREMNGPSYHSIAVCLGNSKKLWPKLVDEWVAQKSQVGVQVDTVVQGTENTQSELKEQSNPKENVEAKGRNAERAYSSEPKAWVEQMQASRAEAVSAVGLEINPVVNKTETEDKSTIEEVSLVIHGLEINCSLGDKRMKLKVSFGSAEQHREA